MHKISTFVSATIGIAICRLLDLGNGPVSKP